jgi:predicted NodU family carbamoyl transferase
LTINIGINIGHDSGATLISGNEVISSVSEERFSRIKGNVGFPEFSLEYFAENYSDLFANPKNVTVNIEGLKFLPWQKSNEDMQPHNLPLIRKCLDYSRISDYLLGTRSGLELSTRLMKIQQLGEKQKLERIIRHLFRFYYMMSK